MGHIALGTLQQLKKRREVIGLLGDGASIEDVAEAAARASEAELRGARDDPSFRFVAQLPGRLPLLARAPGFEAGMAGLGPSQDALNPVTGLLEGINRAINDWHTRKPELFKKHHTTFRDMTLYSARPFLARHDPHGGWCRSTEARRGFMA